MTPVYKLSANSVKNGRTVYGSMLAGNAAFSPSAFESIATTTLSSSSSTITFSSIPSTYQHLQIRAIVRTATVTTDSSGYIRFNSDSGTNYAWHWLYGNGTSALATGGATQDKIQIMVSMPGASYSTSIYGASIVDIHDYASTTKNKTVRTFNGVDNNSGSTSSKVNLVSGLWINTNAITSITITGFNDFAAGSVFSLYGIKGA